MKKAIAMKCNQEQFEAIKPKLEKAGVGSYRFIDISEFPYLTSPLKNNEKVSNHSLDTMNRVREIHKTWNERIFLEACGIETQETFEITKETIIKYKMKDEFPEVFEVRLENNTWYVCHHYSSRHLVNLNITDKLDTHNKGFGFDSHGKWTNDLTFLKTHYYGFTKATEQEVFEALKNEAVKRGFVEGVYLERSGINKDFNHKLYSCGDFSYYPKTNILDDQNGNGHIFHNGTWATIIETKTKEEAEKLLNCKIID